ncbi:MAG: NAD(+)/NADH kinase [Nanoarchaeota archaeon]|nr:NAD(+)/NADH kinase [Nanoarchaeota archaeon]MBU1269888.1 NAD(+)/NADH kinase [Nanoarchaeota archaeon]MBU1603938.1 NAD(+)/NADH kinase [Nanoarchaeota archaeon]MBU2442555.1 NAD(+)/NADH kinase [Nanoarchaeota archaeon]
MKRVALNLKDKSKLAYMKKIIKDNKLNFVVKNPDFVISLGGDGTFLMSERKYPGVPKLIIRDSKTCHKCVGMSEETVLELIKMNEFNIKEEMMLESSFKDEKIIAVNDIIIRNKSPNQAIRLDLHVNDRQTHEEVIGDGVVVSTPFGSTAYFKSITRKTFEKGIGVAFSNSVKEHKPLMLDDDSVLKVQLVRGDAQIASDNNPKIFILKEGSTITIKKSKETAKIIIIKGL